MPTRRSKKCLILLLALTAVMAWPGGVELANAMPSSQARIGAKVGAAPKRARHVTRYRVEYRNHAVNARVVGGYTYRPHLVRVGHKGKTHVVQRGVKLVPGYRVAYAPASWHTYRVVERPEAAVQIAAGLRGMGLQTRIVRRHHRI